VRPRIVALLAAAAIFSACERGMHEMYDQAKYPPLTPTTLFADGNSARPQVPGTVAYSAGSAAASNSGRNGAVPVPVPAGPAVVLGAGGRDLLSGGTALRAGSANPLPVTAALLRRGQERFDIYCAPCHSQLGDGDGMIVRRGFPAPPSYHTDRLRGAPDSHFYQVITHGYGAMYAYADRIAPEDRWAIVAYIRALQLSQHAPAALLSRVELQRLGERRP
jgi:mono/diheme cytochrome c family protein